MKYFPFGECLESPPYPTDILFTGQRLDATGLYYYGARYYDAGMGRFISPDTIIPDPANPQSFNRYSYCLNNPLKYTDPSGRIVTIEGIDVRSISTYMQYYSGYFGASAIFQSAGSMGIYLGYSAFRNVSPELQALENAEETVYTELGTPPHGWAASYDPSTKTVTISEDFSSNSHKDVLTLAHEIRHAWQDVVASQSGKTTFDQLKWHDTVYCEWDAYKYQADLNDQFGWGLYWAPWNNQLYFQGLDLETSWMDYNKAYSRFAKSRWEHFLWWEIYTPYIIRTLTEEMYRAR
jgi:RHS repeat-associated protein